MVQSELYLTWMKCISVSQRIIWSSWWASCALSCGCQMNVCISRWKGKQQTQTGSQQAKSAAGEAYVTHVSTLLAMNWLQTCAELSSEIGIASSTIHKILTQNLKILKCRKSVHSCYYTRGTVRKQPDCIGDSVNLKMKLFFTGDIGPFTWTWTEETVIWMIVSGITTPMKMLTGTGSVECLVHCGLQWQGCSPHTRFSSWHYSKCCSL